MGNLRKGEKISPQRFCNGFELVMQIRHEDQQKVAWFENDLCESCALYIVTLQTIDLFYPQNV